MFKGISPEFKAAIEKFNAESEFFIFNLSDLEQGNYDNDSKKYYLNSDELKQKINKIIQERKQPGENIPYLKSMFFNRCSSYKGFVIGFAYDYNWWFTFSKDSIYEMAKRGVEQGKNNFLIYDGEGEENSTFNIPVRLGSYEILDKEINLIEKLKEKIFQLRRSSLNEIDQAIEKTKINLNSLEIRYPDLIPYDCRCEMIPNQDGTWKNPYHYRSHINNCLGRDETELIEFKETMLEQIRLGKISFENYRNSIIAEVKAIAVEKNVQEGSFWVIGDWKEWLRSSNSRSILQFQKKCLVESIENCKEEQQRKAQREVDRLKQEQELREQEETKKRIWQEQQEKEQRKKSEREGKEREKELKKKKEEKERRYNLPFQPGGKTLAELTLVETKEMVQKSLTRALNTHHFQNNDLSPEFRNWAKKIKGMKTKEEVLIYQDFVLDSIQRVIEKRKINSEQKSINSSLGIQLLILVSLIFWIGLLFLIIKKKIFS